MKKPFGAPEVRDIRAWLESKYRFFICTVAFPEFGEEVMPECSNSKNLSAPGISITCASPTGRPNAK